MSYLDRLFSLRGKTALVTGASRGIGLAIASGLLQSGATVILVDRELQLLESETEVLRNNGLDAHCIMCDLSEPDQINNLISEVRQHFKQVNVLVNNAGITTTHEMVTYPLKAWEETIGVNLRAPFLLVQRVVCMMRESGGSIINITSINAELGFPSNPAYAAAKGGLKQLTKALAVDLGKFDIRVNNIGPGYVATEMTAKSCENTETRERRTRRTILGRWGVPQDVVGLAILLASDASSYITGQDFYVDGGWIAKGL